MLDWPLIYSALGQLEEQDAARQAELNAVTAERDALAAEIKLLTTVLTDLSFEVAHGPSVLMGAAQGTKICTVTGIDNYGAPIALDSLAFAAGGDDAGHLQINGFDLEVGPAGASFETSADGSAEGSQGILAYYATVIATKGGVSVERRQRIRPKLNYINPTGAVGGGTAVPTAASNLNYALTYPSVNGFLDCRNYNGVHVADNNVTLDIGGPTGKTDWTWQGNRRFMTYRGGRMRMQKATNVIIRDVAFRVGPFVPGVGLDNRDSFEGNQLQDVIFENCSFTWGVDETLSIILSSTHTRYPRKIRFHRCLFAEALSNAGHPKGNHPFGPLTYTGTMNVVYTKCFIGGFSQRSPEFNRNKGALVQNNIIANYGPGGSSATPPGNGGTGFYSSADKSDLHEFSGLVRGNLYKPWRGSTRALISAIALNQLGSGGFLKIEPTSSPYANHFMHIGTDGVRDFTAQPVDPATAVLYKDCTANVAQAMVDWDPFDLENDYGLMPTATEANREALFDDVLDYVGVRARDESGNLLPGDENATRIDYDILQRFRATGGTINPAGCYPNGPTGAYDESATPIAYYYNVPGEPDLIWPPP